MKKIFTVCILFLWSTLTFANSPVDTLDKILANLDAFQANFIQTTQSKQFGNQVTKGTMMLQRPGKFRWEITEPDHQELISDGTTLWIYDKDLSQVIIQPLSQRLDETPALLLSGQAGSIERFFDVTVVDQKSKTWYELKSRDKEGLVDKVMMSFENGGIKEMQIFDNLGQRTDISFTDMKQNVRFADNAFTFTPPAGVEVIKNQ